MIEAVGKFTENLLRYRHTDVVQFAIADRVFASYIKKLPYES